MTLTLWWVTRAMTEVLRQAGAHRAEAVLAMLADDSENAFTVLAVKD